MKKMWVILLIMLLTGCGKPESYETMSDQYFPAELPAAGVLQLSLPEEAAVLTLANESSGTLYMCQDYSIVVQTLPSGNLDATLRELTGYSRDRLQLYSRQQGSLQRYDCVWSSAGELGQQVGKAAIWDDGSFHYGVCMLMPEDMAEQLEPVWQQILTSVTVE